MMGRQSRQKAQRRVSAADLKRFVVDLLALASKANRRAEETIEVTIELAKQMQNGETASASDLAIILEKAAEHHDTCSATRAALERIKQSIESGPKGTH
jgi:hypothetical protein